MKILANSCPKCGTATNVVRDVGGRYVEVNPGKARVLTWRADGWVEHKDATYLVIHRCRKPRAVPDKGGLPRAKRRGLPGTGEAGE